MKNIFFFLCFILCISCKKETPKTKRVTETRTVVSNAIIEKKEYQVIDSIIKPVSKISKDFFITKFNTKKHFGTEKVYLKDSKGTIIENIDIDIEAYNNDTKVYEITNHNLTNVKKVINFTIEECICGCNIKEYYFLLTNDNQYIKLPTLNYSSVEYIDPYYEYAFGKLNTIYATENKPNELSKIYEINRTSKLIWNGEKIATETVLNPKKYIVNSLSGLTVRDQPSLKGKKIGGLPYMSEVNIQENTGIQLAIQDEGKTVEGNWVKIENDISGIWKSGFVFNGFLQDKTSFIKNNKAILTTSCYVDDFYKKELKGFNNNWIELYENSGYYLLAEPKTTKQKNINECTGNNITCINSERNTILFINNLKLKEHFFGNAVKVVPPPNDVLWSGEKYNFDLRGDEYSLIASGNFTTRNQENNIFYTLTLESKTKSQVIFQQKQFKDTVPKIIFIGDIDKDNKPDIILSSPRNYEEERKILFLSSDAIDGNLIKKTAEITIDFSC